MSENKQAIPRKYKAPKREKDLPFDVLALSDGDLARQLRVLGATVGPITNATRPLYQKKLSRLLTEEARNPPPQKPPAKPKDVSPPKKQPEPEEYSADEQEEESGDAAAEEEAMEIDENSVIENDELDAPTINRNSFARRRYVAPKSAPEPQPVPMPTRRSLRGKADREDDVKNVTQQKVKGEQEKTQEEEGDGFASTLKFLLFAIVAMIVLVLMVYVVMEGNPPSADQIDSISTASGPSQSA